MCALALQNVPDGRPHARNGSLQKAQARVIRGSVFRNCASTGAYRTARKSDSDVGIGEHTPQNECTQSLFRRIWSCATKKLLGFKHGARRRSSNIENYEAKALPIQKRSAFKYFGQIRHKLKHSRTRCHVGVSPARGARPPR